MSSQLPGIWWWNGSGQSEVFSGASLLTDAGLSAGKFQDAGLPLGVIVACAGAGQKGLTIHHLSTKENYKMGTTRDAVPEPPKKK